jgi:hypothetical protein
MDSSLEEEIRAVINRHSAENRSNTPDYILAAFLIGALDAYERAVLDRDEWYDISPSPGWLSTQEQPVIPEEGYVVNEERP